jgi:hypothetical protein
LITSDILKNYWKDTMKRQSAIERKYTHSNPGNECRKGTGGVVSGAKNNHKSFEQIAVETQDLKGTVLVVDDNEDIIEIIKGLHPPQTGGIMANS